MILQPQMLHHSRQVVDRCVESRAADRSDIRQQNPLTLAKKESVPALELMPVSMDRRQRLPTDKACVTVFIERKLVKPPVCGHQRQRGSGRCNCKMPLQDSRADDARLQVHVRASSIQIAQAFVRIGDGLFQNSADRASGRIVCQFNDRLNLAHRVTVDRAAANQLDENVQVAPCAAGVLRRRFNDRDVIGPWVAMIEHLGVIDACMHGSRCACHYCSGLQRGYWPIKFAKFT